MAKTFERNFSLNMFGAVTSKSPIYKDSKDWVRKLAGSSNFIVKDGEGVYTQEIDLDKEGLKDKVQLDRLTDFFESDYIDSSENTISIDNGFLCYLGNDLYEFHYDTQKSEKVLSLSTYGIFSSDLLFLSKNKDTIEMIHNNGDSGYSEYIFLRMGATEKQTLTLGVTMTPQDLEQIVMEFNRYNSEYAVEIVDYLLLADNHDDALELLKLDVVTGKAPDIIAVSGIDYNMFSEKGVFADLYEFMQEDEEFTKSMLVQSVAKQGNFTTAGVNVGIMEEMKKLAAKTNRDCVAWLELVLLNKSPLGNTLFSGWAEPKSSSMQLEKVSRNASIS